MVERASLTGERVKLGEVLTPVRRPVTVDPVANYTEIGVRSYGRGVFHKAPVLGMELGKKRVFWIEPGELVMNIVFAWEGATAITRTPEKGTIGSHRFVTFQHDDEALDLRYISYFFRSETGLEILRKASPGSAGRNRTLNVNRVLEQSTYLPPRLLQSEIADRLEVIEATEQRILEREVLRPRDVDVFDHAHEEYLERLRQSGWVAAPVSSVAQVNPVVPKVKTASFVGMRSISEDGQVVGAEVVPTSNLKSGYKRFCRGDVLFARITPCMQNGKTAIFEGPTDVGYGTTEVHVLRPVAVSAEWLHMWVRRRAFRAAAARAFQGTAGHQRVPWSFFDREEILLPPSDVAESEVLAVLQYLSDGQRLVRDGLKRREAIARALLPAAMNEEFAVFRD